MPWWWNGRHSGLRNRRPKGYESSSLSLGTKKVAMTNTGSKPGCRV